MSDFRFDSQPKMSALESTRPDPSKFDEAEVFANALELIDLNARQSYLDEVASLGSVERQRVERLLSYAASSTDFLEASATDPPQIDSSRIESVGDWLGPYRLLQQIGEGGMGTVYMAEQTSPLQRRVAIKVIKPGMDSSQVLARFEAERQALALMEHPNIARAIDVGISSHGRTYFVMELVRGVPITRYCDDLRLNARQRLELFIPVCLAIQHAHQKGIIHRDLKPSNVLVAEYDGVAVPKVIDFGVAKALNQQLTCKTLFTQFGQIVGTMEYMSPEQSRINQLDIDTRSDIYSLGVLLYELITGTTPIQSHDLKDLGWDELVRMIREEDAPPPSQRLSTIERIQLIAQQRNTEPAKLSGFVKGELDWIVLKALDKQRTRRYQNATELAEDVRRFLEGSEVLACPPSTSYRARKYLEKHKFAFLASGLVTAALVVGLAGTAWQAWHASRARVQAERQRDIANAETQRAQQAQSKAQLEAVKAEKEAEITRAVANFVNYDLIAFADPSLEPDRDVRLRTIMDRASEKVASLHAAPLVEASIRYTLAKSYVGLGEYRLALDHAKTSWETRCEHLSQSHPDTLASQLLLADAELKLSRFQQASKTYESAMQISIRSTALDDSIKLDCQHGYGVSLARLGKLEAAMATLKSVAENRRRLLGEKHVQTLETDREIAEILFQQGDYLEAMKSFDLAVAKMTEYLGDSHPLTLRTLAGAANVAAELGNTEGARNKREFILSRQNKILGQTHPDTLLTASKLTLVSQRNLDPAGAIAKNTELLKVAEERLGSEHAVSLSIVSALSEILSEHGRSTEATKHLERCRLALQNLHQGLNEGSSPELLQIQFRIAGCLAFEGKYQPALTLYRQTLADQQSLLSPKHLDILKTEYGYAVALMTSGDYRAAEEQLLQLIATTSDSNLKNHPLVQSAESQLATLESVLGRASCLERHQQVRDAARAKYGPRSAIGLYLDIAFAESLLRFGRAAEAKQVLEESLAVVDHHYQGDHPIHGQLQDALIEALAGIGDFAAAIQRAEELWRARKAAYGNQHPLTLRCLNQWGALLVQSGQPGRGAVLIKEAFERSREAFGKDSPQTLNYQQNLASTLGVLSVSDRSLRPQTLRLFEELLDIQIAYGADHPSYLSSQISFAGALAQQGRFLQAERVFQQLLPKLIKTYGESHPLPLRCRENFSSVLGSLGKYQQAIEQCRSFLLASPTSSPSSRKVTHAAIQYHICLGTILKGLDLYESAFKISSKPNVDLEWLFLDVPFFIDAIAQSGEPAKAVGLLEDSVTLFSEKLGSKHPQRLFLAAKLLSLYRHSGQPEKAKVLLEQLTIDTQSTDGQTCKSSAQVMANIAARWQATHGLQAASMYGLAAQELLVAEPPTDSSGLDSEQNQESPGIDYGALALKSISDSAHQGKLRSPREQHWLKYSTDLDSLRDRDDYKQVVYEVDNATEIERTMRLSWNLAIVGEHQEAANLLRDFSLKQAELATLGAVQFLTARTWARCYQAASKQGLNDLAADYLEQCRLSLENSKAKGYLKHSAEGGQLIDDENFETVRDKISNFDTYSVP